MVFKKCAFSKMLGKSKRAKVSGNKLWRKKEVSEQLLLSAMALVCSLR
jgi:hypothetical protein